MLYIVMFGYGRRPSHCNAHTWNKYGGNETLNDGFKRELNNLGTRKGHPMEKNSGKCNYRRNHNR
jgi:hypothetical protein